MNVKLITLTILLCCFTGVKAQTLKTQGGRDEMSVSTAVKNGVPSARVIIQSPLKLNYKSNMADLTSEDIVRGYANEFNVDTLYFYIVEGDNKRRLTISADGYASETLPFHFAAKQTYKYLIFDPDANSNGAPQSANLQSLTIKCSPSDVELIIDNGESITITGGEGNMFLPYGKHRYSVRSRLYKTLDGIVEMGQERQELNLQLEANYGYVEFNSTPSGAVVEIDGVVVGKTPCKSAAQPLGEHTVKFSASNFVPYTQRVSLVDVSSTLTVSASLVSDLSQINISCPMSDVTIVIDGVEQGKGDWSGKLLTGVYELKAERSGHRPVVQQLVVEHNTPQSISLNAPTPIYGGLNISAAQSGVVASIDGKVLGTLPNTFRDVLVGKQILTLSKEGFVAAEVTVEINEGAVTEYKHPALMSIKDSEEYKAKEKMLKRTNYVFNAAAYIAMGSPKELVIPEGYTSIAIGSKSLTANMTSRKNIKSVVIPNSVTKLEDYAFYWCSELTSISIPNSVTSIGQSAFGACHKITSLEIPNSVTSIGFFAFSGCNNLISITIPNSVVSIGSTVTSSYDGRKIFIKSIFNQSKHYKTQIITISKSSPILNELKEQQKKASKNFRNYKFKLTK